MAVRRMVNPKARARLRAAHIARVRRTVKKVQRGKVAIEDVVPALRGFVQEELDRAARK